MPLHLDEKSSPGPQAIDWQRVALGYEQRIADLEDALTEIASAYDPHRAAVRGQVNDLAEQMATIAGKALYASETTKAR